MCRSVLHCSFRTQTHITCINAKFHSHLGFSGEIMLSSVVLNLMTLSCFQLPWQQEEYWTEKPQRKLGWSNNQLVNSLHVHKRRELLFRGKSMNTQKIAL